jgi:protein-S-isoprenylcysteine O-methyltransferase Ste14
MTTNPNPTVAQAGSPMQRVRTASLGLDLLERGLVLALYAWLVQRMLANWAAGGSPANLLLLPSEGLVILLILCRRSTTQVSPRVGDWLIAWGATLAPLLVEPGSSWPAPLPTVGAVVMLVGMLVQVHAKLVLGRRLGLVPAHRGLTFSGPYRFVRHPMYAGYLIGHLGFCAVNFSAWNLAMYALCYALQLPRLLREERWLRGDPRYAQYMASVRYRLIPGVF